MNALLDPIHFSPPMSVRETVTLTIRIDAALKRKLEAGAMESNLTLDEHVSWLIEEAVFVNGPEFFDPDNWEAHEYRLVQEARRSSALGHDLPLEQVEREIEEHFGAERSSDLPNET
ncbi:putative transcriptional regulator [Mitsuaria sp. BK045]|uniref:hypothetical protein n=1 Tax=unclassified Roseateles TaxID=2626991 RepID=UPI00161739DF|nr:MULTISPECIES: hypothetical protein [unclassified Roseateles]MBB3292041.1 putative transcriptional regulator [Mitsuaria sp. BK041]MBB3361258.1 putative transcriptional regulator [Mitsuaria sp. BK045]